MNLSWYLFYGRRINMTKQEILITPFGEMMDMISCLAIYEGTADPIYKKKWTFDEAMRLK